MQLYELNEGRDAELMCGLMASIKPAGGKHLEVPARGARMGHLKGDQISVFCTELESYAKTRPKLPETNRTLMRRITRALRTKRYRSVLIVRRGVGMKIYASGIVGAFDGVVETRNEIASATSQFDIELAAL